MKRAFVIGIVGAGGSGRTTLAWALQERLAAQGLPAIAPGGGVVVADAPSLAVHSDLTLLMALDLPQAADGSPRVRTSDGEIEDARIRAALLENGRPFAVVTGLGPARLASAWRAVRPALGLPADDAADAGSANWQWRCERCGDAACERRLLPVCPAPSC